MTNCVIKNHSNSTWCGEEANCTTWYFTGVHHAILPSTPIPCHKCVKAIVNQLEQRTGRKAYSVKITRESGELEVGIDKVFGEITPNLEGDFDVRFYVPVEEKGE